MCELHVSPAEYVCARKVEELLEFVPLGLNHFTAFPAHSECVDDGQCSRQVFLHVTGTVGAGFGACCLSSKSMLLHAMVLSPNWCCKSFQIRHRPERRCVREGVGREESFAVRDHVWLRRVRPARCNGGGHSHCNHFSLIYPSFVLATVTTTPTRRPSGP